MRLRTPSTHGRRGAHNSQSADRDPKPLGVFLTYARGPRPAPKGWLPGNEAQPSPSILAECRRGQEAANYAVRHARPNPQSAPKPPNIPEGRATASARPSTVSIPRPGRVLPSSPNLLLNSPARLCQSVLLMLVRSNARGRLCLLCWRAQLPAAPAGIKCVNRGPCRGRVERKGG